jgi:charged multivesicular body protein 1
MGAKQSLADDLLQFRLTSKELARDSKKAMSRSEAEKKKALAAMKAGNIEGSRVYAQNAIREKKFYLQYLKLSSQIDGVASRLEQAIRMQKTSATMAQTVKGMTGALKSMNVDKITSTMEQFSKLFDDMDVNASIMAGAMDATNASSTPAEEVDLLLQQIGDEAGLDTADMLNAAGKGASALPAQKAAATPEDDLEARLAALRS